MATILFVEDEDAVRGLVTKVLRKAGHEVVDCSHIDEAEGAYAPGLYALVMADNDCPALGAGKKFLQRLQQGHGQQVLLMSGRQVDDADHLPFLAKPFLPSELMTKLDELLDRA